MINHPIVECRNLQEQYLFTMRINSSYRDVLQRRLALLEDWANRHSLESATQLINDTLRNSPDYTYPAATPREINKVVFGDRGLVTGTKMSLSPQGNPYNPHRGNRLTRKNGSPFFLDQEGNYYLRGEVIQGHYPLRKPNNQFGCLRRCIELNLNLPLYTRHRVRTYDETVCRDAGGNPV